MEFGFYNMDCIDGMKQFPDSFFDLAIVDPVYGDVKQGGYMYNKGGGIAGTKKYNNAIWKQEKTGQEYFNELFRVSKNQIIWGGNYFVECIQKNSTCWIVWDKDRPDGVTYSDCELAWTSFPSAARLFKYRWNGFLQQNMKNREERIHPTQKPVALYEWILCNFAKPGYKILDTHVGSASSLIACYNMGFEYVGFELVPDYYKKAVDRLETHKQQMTLFDQMNKAPEQCVLFEE